MLSRRQAYTLLGAAALAPLAAACTSTGAIDPVAVANDLKIGCGIAVPLSTIATVINAAVGATAQMIIDLICSSFKASVAQGAKLGMAPLAVGASHEFVVVVNGKAIPVEATIVKAQ